MFCSSSRRGGAARASWGLRSVVLSAQSSPPSLLLWRVCSFKSGMATQCWCKGVVAIGGRHAGSKDPTLIGTGFIVDLPTGLVSTCAHVVLNAFYDEPDGCLDPGVHGLAIGVGFGEQIRWVCRAKVLFISRPPANYDDNACPKDSKPKCKGLGPLQAPQARKLKDRACSSCGTNWTGLPIQKGPPPSHWPVQDSTNKRLDLAVLRLVDLGTGSPLVDPASELAHSPGKPAHALRLGDSTALKDGEPLVMLGYGQEAGTGDGQERTSTVTRGVASTKTGRWLKTDAMVLSGHSGGPMVNRFGEVVGWAVQSMTMAELRPVELLLAPLDQVLRSIVPARSGPLGTLLARLQGHATDRPELDDEALQACHAAAARAEAYAVQAKAAAASAGESAIQARSAVGDAQLAAQIGALQVQRQMGYAQVMAAENMLASLLASRGSNVDIVDQQAGAGIVMPLLRSPTPDNASPPPSPARSQTEMWLEIDGDFPQFDVDGFKNNLARFLHHEVEPSKIIIEDDKEDERQVAVRVSTGRCKVKVRYNLYSGGMFTEADEPTLKEQLKGTLKDLIRRFWPSEVDVESIRVRLAVKGSVILLIELPQPLPVLLLQLAAQRSTELLNAVPGLLCCQLGGRVVRLEGCEDRHVGTLDVLQALQELDLGSDALQNAAAWCVENEPSSLADIRELDEPDLNDFLDALSLPEDPKYKLRVKLVGEYAAKYAFTRLIGKGGFGETNLVRDRRSDQQYASKLISRPTQMEADEALREFYLMQELRHPMLVEAFESFREPTSKGEFTVSTALLNL